MASRISGIASEASKWLGAFLAAIAILMVATYLRFGFFSPSVDSFCEGLSDEDTPQTVRAKARAQEMVSLDLIKERGRITVFNHEAYFFRRACMITFKDGKISSKTTMAAD